MHPKSSVIFQFGGDINFSPPAQLESPTGNQLKQVWHTINKEREFQQMALDIGCGLMADNLELYVCFIYFLFQWPGLIASSNLNTPILFNNYRQTSLGSNNKCSCKTKPVIKNIYKRNTDNNNSSIKVKMVSQHQTNSLKPATPKQHQQQSKRHLPAMTTTATSAISK